MRSIDRTRCFTRALLGILALVVLPAGCIETYKPGKSLRPTTERLVVQHTAGGTHYCMALSGNVWYQLFGTDLLVLSPRTGAVIHREPLSGAGNHAPATAMLLHQDELWIVMEDVAVVRLALDDPRRPWIDETISAGILGIRPRGVGVIGEDVVTYGVGGVVDPQTRRRLVTTEGEVVSVADTTSGAVYCEDRRIHRMADGNYLGSASWLQVLPGTSPWGEDAIIFVRQEDDASIVGLMDDSFREIDGSRLAVMVPGVVHAVRLAGDRLLVVSEQGIGYYAQKDGALSLDSEWAISGLLDAEVYKESTLLMSGSLGRGIARPGDEHEGDVLVFEHFTPEPAGLTHAVSDGRSVLATSPGGDWLYRIGSDVVQVAPTDRTYGVPPTSAVTLGWEATIQDEGRQMSVTTPIGTDSMVAPNGGRFTCVAASEGVLWLGHESGIIMVRLPLKPAALPDGWGAMSETERAEIGLGAMDGMTKLSVRLDGPIVFLEPLMLGGGVAYVSRDGGFGVVAEELQ